MKQLINHQRILVCQTISTESGNLVFNPSTNIDFNSKNVIGGASIECSTITTDGVSNLWINPGGNIILEYLMFLIVNL